MMLSGFNRVMIIDSDLIERFATKDTIDRKGFSKIILEYDNAFEALQYLIKNQNLLFMLPQVIFIDVDMPRISGFEFIDIYDKMSYVLKNTCKVFITSSIELRDSDLSKLDNKSIISFLKKPITKEQLDVIERLVY